jgi:hypothetical protein
MSRQSHASLRFAKVDVLVEYPELVAETKGELNDAIAIPTAPRCGGDAFRGYDCRMSRQVRRSREIDRNR